MISRQVVTFAQLEREGLKGEEIKNLYASLKIFPTPFKGVYYVPSQQERSGWFIEKPLQVLSKAIAVFLGGERFYFSCGTAEEFWGLKPRGTEAVHAVNAKKSIRIDLGERALRNKSRGTFRSGKVAQLLSYYGKEIVLHKNGFAEKADARETPYGRYASKKQIEKDRKKFKCALR